VDNAVLQDAYKQREHSWYCADLFRFDRVFARFTRKPVTRLASSDVAIWVPVPGLAFCTAGQEIKRPTQMCGGASEGSDVGPQPLPLAVRLCGGAASL